MEKFKNLFYTNIRLVIYISASFLVATLLYVGVVSLLLFHVLAVTTFFDVLITTFAIFMVLQGSFTIYWMLYAWENEEQIEKNRLPLEFKKPHCSFSAIIPARDEKFVIYDTVKAIHNIDYPNDLKETIVVCRYDDAETIAEVQRLRTEIEDVNIKLVLFNSYPINKPHSLNLGLKYATKELVAVFDAEDQPHNKIYNILNTVFLNEKIDIVQAGVQLMNYRSNWFSTLNILEYFFWFKSTLHFFSNMGVVPLGGNTVFFKKVWLDKVNGWDEHCLTEDADIGIRLSNHGAKIRVLYDEAFVTQEETPPTLSDFIKQRTRWNQGFVQVLLKSDWKQFPKWYQKALAAYMLMLPEIQAVLFLLIPVSILLVLTVKLPIIVAMITLLPMLVLVLQIVTYNIGLFEFTRNYHFSYPLWMPLKLFITFMPYQFILGYSATRAMYRLLSNNINWEKTLHVNEHRKLEELSPAITS